MTKLIMIKSYLILANYPVKSRQSLCFRSKMDNAVVALAFLHSHNLKTIFSIFVHNLKGNQTFAGFLPPFAGSQTPGSCHQPAPLQRDRLGQAARASTDKSVNRNLFGFLPGQARWELGFEHLHWCSWSLECLTWESYYNHKWWYLWPSQS